MENAFADAVENRFRDGVRAWFPVAAYMALIFYLSSLSHPEETLPKFLFEKLSDKLLHLIEYAVLAVLCYRGFRLAAGRSAAKHAVLLTIVATSLNGLTDEVHQAFVPFRTATWQDWVADTSGGVIGAIASERLIEPRAKRAFRDKHVF